MAGDKTLYGDPNLKGALIGLGIGTNRDEITRAIMEGFAFAFRQLMEAMEIKREQRVIKATGGMTGNAAFMQILADILNAQIEVANHAGAALGIAHLAAQSCNATHEHLPIQKEIDCQVFHPKNALVEAYDNKYEAYLRIHNALNHIYHEQPILSR